MLGVFIDKLGSKSPVLCIRNGICVHPATWKGRIDMCRVVPIDAPRVCEHWDSNTCVVCEGDVTGYDQSAYRTVWTCNVCGEHVTPHRRNDRKVKRLRGPEEHRKYVPSTGRTITQDHDLLVKHGRAVRLRAGSSYFGSGGFSAGFTVISGTATVVEVDEYDNGFARIRTLLVRRTKGCKQLVIDAWDGDGLGPRHSYRPLGPNGRIVLDEAGYRKEI